MRTVSGVGFNAVIGKVVLVLLMCGTAFAAVTLLSGKHEAFSYTTSDYQVDIAQCKELGMKSQDVLSAPAPKISSAGGVIIGVDCIPVSGNGILHADAHMKLHKEN